MTKTFLLHMSVLVFVFSHAALAAPEQLLKSRESWDGGKIAYPIGEAEIVSVKLVLQEGKDTPFHCHPIPTLGYIAKGTVELETSEGKKIQFEQGASVVEAMKTLHRGKSLQGEAEIIVFYASAINVPVTVFPDDKENFEKYCQ